MTVIHSEIQPAKYPHKFQVVVKKGNKTKVVKFGHRDYQDFTQHADPERRRRYLARASKIRNKKGKLTMNDPFSANYWSMRYLWSL